MHLGPITTVHGPETIEFDARVRANQRRLAAEIRPPYDFIVCAYPYHRKFVIGSRRLISCDLSSSATSIQVRSAACGDDGSFVRLRLVKDGFELRHRTNSSPG